MRRLAACLALIGVAVAVNAVVVGDLRPPDRWNPWAPLDIRAPATLVTPLKLARLERDAAYCRASLASSDLEWTPVPDDPPEDPCGLSGAVGLTGGAPGLGGRTPVVVTCPVAVALARWMADGIAPAAMATLGSPVVRLEHWGTHVCRTIAGSSRLSEHATANAIDIAGFHLKDGRHVSVLRDWPGDGAEARFLRAVRDAACGSFDVVLGPAYNAAHADHFHLDMGRYSVCR